MTIEEAKNQLEELIQDRQSFICGGDDEIYKADIEALKMAIGAIDKQISKKAKGRACPQCGGDVSIYQVPYCCNCGQALDWSDKNE